MIREAEKGGVMLPVRPVAEVEESEGVPWLVEGLWVQGGVGFLCGSPKACKTWLALDLALSVATQTPALGRYAVPEKGSVLVFAAEDAPPMVRTRLSGIAQQRGESLVGLGIHLVLASSLRLEDQEDQQRLQNTIAHYQPKLVLLDPFVRLSSVDENSAREVSAVLAYLRQLQRAHNVAILVVHHARKSSGNGAPAGLALRGSGDFWAWSDTNLYLHRKHDKLHLTIEHRSAAPPDPVCFELCEDLDSGPYLRMCDQGTSSPSAAPADLASRILEALHAGDGPTRLDDLRAILRVRMQSLVNALRELEQEEKVQRIDGAWGLAPPSPTIGEEALDKDENLPGETEAGSAEA